MGDNAAGRSRDRPAMGAVLTWSEREASMWSSGTFYWNELMTRDVEKAKQFYGATLGWTFDAMPNDQGTYWVAKSGDQPVAGILPMVGPDYDNEPEGWVAYVAVKDLSTALARATSEGGQVVREPFEVPGVGRIAIVADAQGIVLGWMTPSEQ
jgi:predicted enzyme related to lactoylglutathione lyase